MATYLNPIPYQSSTDPRKIAQNQRDRITGQGDVINQEELNRAAQAEQAYQGTTDFLTPIEQQLASGQGGYTPEEAAQVMDQGGLPTPLTDQQAADIKGNPYQASQYASHQQDYLTDLQKESAGNTRTAVGALQSGLNTAANNPALQASSDYVGQTADAINAGDTGVANTLEQQAARTRGAIDPAQLNQSEAASRAEQMSPEDRQAMITSAGISAGLKDQEAVDAAQRQAQAAGASPMGVAAYRARLARQQAVDSGNAMTQARAATQAQAAQEAQQAEQQRLGASQYLSGATVGNESNLGAATTAAQQEGTNRRVQAAQNIENTRLGAQQFQTGAQMQAATTGGQAQVANEQNIGAQQQQTGQFNTATNTAALQNAEQQASNRAATTQQTGFQQGMDTSNARSSRAANVGQTRIGQQNVGIAGQQQQAQTQNQNAQNAYGRQQQTYATQTGGSNQASNLGVEASQTPSTFDKVMGGITGAVSGALKLDEGGVITKPTVGWVGENGPEMITPYRAKVGQGLQAAAGAVGGMARPRAGSGIQSLGSTIGQLGNAYRARQQRGNRIAQLGQIDQQSNAPMQPVSPPESMAEGKLVTKPTLALLGEDGPEQVTPLSYRSRARVRPSSVQQPPRPSFAMV